MYNAINIIDVILRKGLLDLDIRTRSGLTALHFAALVNDLRIIRRLIEPRADLDAKNNHEPHPARSCYFPLSEKQALRSYFGNTVGIPRPLERCYAFVWHEFHSKTRLRG